MGPTDPRGRDGASQEMVPPPYHPNGPAVSPVKGPREGVLSGEKRGMMVIRELISVFQ